MLELKQENTAQSLSLKDARSQAGSRALCDQTISGLLMPMERTLVRELPLGDEFAFGDISLRKVICRNIESPLVIVTYERELRSDYGYTTRHVEGSLRLDTDKRAFFDQPEGGVDGKLLSDAAAQVSDHVDGQRMIILAEFPEGAPLQHAPEGDPEVDDLSHESPDPKDAFDDESDFRDQA